MRKQFGTFHFAPLALIAILVCLSSCDCDRRSEESERSRVDRAGREPLRASAIVAGGEHACALLIDNSIACWGGNDAGQVGENGGEPQTSPRRLAGIRQASEVTAGFAATCSRGSEDRLQCLGRMHSGFPGNPAPRVAALVANAREVGLARLHGCVLDRSGGVACWGSNHFGQLGDGRAPGCGGEISRGRDTPAPVPELNGVAAIAVGDTGTCARLESGAVTCWGRLGLPDALESRARCGPTPIEGLRSVKQVVVGSHHGCGLRQDGEVYCWGANAIGQLGILREGTTPTGRGGGGHPRVGPTKVTGLDDVVELSSFGRAHTCARRRGGQVFCWGRNAEGQLGDGTRTNRYAPVAVVGIEDAVGIATGYAFSCALRRGGEVMCWGSNEQGQLGNGSRRDSPRPVAVAPLLQ